MSSDSITDWPFQDPENLAVITKKNILSGSTPILYVTSDAADGTWQFLDGSDNDIATASIVSLYRMTQLDQSLFDLADLPSGWKAWRVAEKTPWHRGPESS